MAEVSVIVPVYNVEKYLKRCLDSLTNQSFKDIEIIVVDDGSTDRSYSIARNLALNDHRIKLYRQENRGSSHARNVGLNESTGKYIMFLDSDDYYKKDCIEKAYHNIKNNDADICIFGSRFVDENGNYIKSVIPLKKGIAEIKDEKSILLDIENCTWDKIYKSELIKENHIHYIENLYYQDLAFTFTSIMYARKISFVNKELIVYTCGRSGSETKEISNKLFDIFKISDVIIQEYKYKNLYEKYYEEIKAIIIINIIDKLKIMIKCTDKKLKNRFIDNVYNYIQLNFENFNSKYNLYKHPHDFVYFNKHLLKIYIYLKRGRPCR